ncbi:alpha/beta fold hydrolase [Cohnella sp. AR92]|uniref:alpha/beta fold hydrolase n=1 Tax=Cohnella sp. AR92 TaxID=648716 RepID=UPI000F8E8E4E|nr:alpha/beta hydrolase [Cohnella sp. AR92]RUS46524.1 alpha/beta hydrolase [Cohnella sp. AR92]
MPANFCEANGAKLHASIKGQGDSVLLVHGGYSNMSVWDEHVDEIASQFKAIRYDQRGYGQSSGPSGPFSYYEDIKSILDYYQVNNTHIVASSFGGSAAIDFTLRYPEYVNKLILVGPSINGVNYPFRMKWEGILDYLRVNRAGMEKAADVFLQKNFWSYMVPQEEERKRRFKEIYTSNAVFYNSKQSWQRPLTPHAIHRLEEIRKPLLIIEPENDHPFNKKVCEIIHSRVKDSEKIVMNNSGHYPHLEHPSEFTSILLEYLNREP